MQTGAAICVAVISTARTAECSRPRNRGVSLICRIVLVCAGTICICGASGNAEQLWKYLETVDEINNTSVRMLSVPGDDGQSLLALRVEESQAPTLTLSVTQMMLPDETDIDKKFMGIAITMRSTSMEKPMTLKWRMPWMEYKLAVVGCTPDSAREKVFAGDSVTFQLDKIGRRYRFITRGEGYEGLPDALAKVLEAAGKPHTKGDD